MAALGAMHQRVGAVRVLGPAGDAHAHRHGEAVLVERERLLEGQRDALRHAVRQLGRFLAQQHGELVARAGARPCRPAHHLAREALAGGLQQAVADRMAELVVDVPEAVEVEHQHGQRRARARRCGDRFVHRGVELRAVGRPVSVSR